MRTLAPLFALVMLTGLAQASFAGPKEDEEAKTAFTKAKRYFEAEEYEAALPLFRRAYELSGKRPSTTFGLAQCLRVLKRYEEAITRFEEYLKSDPDDRAEVEETIALLRDLEADRKRQAGGTTGATPPPVKPEPKLAPKPEVKPTTKPESTPSIPPTLAPPPTNTEPPLTVSNTPEDEGDGDSVFASPWFWVVTGVVVVGAGVAIGAAAGSSGDRVLYGGSTNVVLFPGQ
jgi:hypothetical protein